MDGFPRGVAGYAPVQLIGRGASALAFKAWQQSSGQFVTIKTPHEGGNVDAAERFAREVGFCARLAHPHVVRLIDAGQAAQARPYCVFEYVPGHTLKDHLLRHGPLDEGHAIDLMGQLLDALACVHGRGLAHRDLTPTNVLVTATGARMHLKLIDFGIAAVLGSEVPAQGTPAYCAPEQLRGEPAAASADIYAWALLFLECLTGRPAVTGASPDDIVRAQLGSGDIAVPPAVASLPVAALLRRMLRKQASLRAVDAKSLYLELMGLRAHSAAVPAVADAVAQAPGRQPLASPAAATVLCLNLMLTPLADAQMALDGLHSLQADHVQWCTEMLAGDHGRPAGAVGDRLLFHFADQDDDSGLRRAAWAALELREQTARRGRLLEIQHGLRLEWRASLHTAQLSPASPAAFGQAANMALHLNSLAPPGGIVASRDARAGLHAFMRFEACPSPDAAAFILLDGH